MTMGDDLESLRFENTLIKCGEQVAGDITKIVNQWHGPCPDIAFNNTPILLKFVASEYFERAKKFKRQHNYPAGERINFSKAAGLLSLLLLEIEAERLFDFPPMLHGSAYPDLARALLVYRLIGAILMLDLSRVDQEVENDLLRCLTLHPDVKADPDWVFWSLRIFQIAYGAPRN